MNTKPSNPKDSLGINKVPASVVSQIVMMEVNLGMFEGASKYGRHNYRDVGIRASIYYDALRRHIDAWWEGQDIDKDSGLNHVTKAICTLIVLRDGMLTQHWTDDRPPPMPDLDKFLEENNAMVEVIRKKWAHLNPEHITRVGLEARNEGTANETPSV